MTPKLSIIVPVYNVESYLRECLDSLVNQTFKDIEIIIVNDCSPDNSEAIILEYQQKDPRIKYIKHAKNLSQGGARNTGLKHAVGEWISFIDSDDYVELDIYTTMLSLIDKHQANLGMFSIINFDDATKKETYDPYFDCDIKTLTTISHQNFNTIRDGIVCNKIFKRSDIVSHHITFPEHLKHEDEEFWFKYVASVKPSVIGSNEKFYHYRQRSNSTMSNFNHRLDLPQVALNIYTFLKQNNLLENYRMIFIESLTMWAENIKLFTKKDSVKFTQEIKKLLNEFQLTPREFQENFVLFYIYTTEQINDNSILYITELFKILDDEWYVFGRLFQKKESKKIAVFLSKKMKIYPFLKNIYKLIRK